jgi:hypothetical protein
MHDRPPCINGHIRSLLARLEAESAGGPHQAARRARGGGRPLVKAELLLLLFGSALAAVLLALLVMS